MKKFISALIVISLLTAATIPALAEGTTTQTPSVTTPKSSNAYRPFKKQKAESQNKQLLQSKAFKTSSERIQKLEKGILELKFKENKLNGLSNEENKASIDQVKGVFKTLKTERELSKADKEQLKAYLSQISTIMKSDKTKDVKLAEIKPIREQIKNIIQGKLSITKEQTTKLEAQKKNLEKKLKAAKTHNKNSSSVVTQ